MPAAILRLFAAPGFPEYEFKILVNLVSVINPHAMKNLTQLNND